MLVVATALAFQLSAAVAPRARVDEATLIARALEGSRGWRVDFYFELR